MESIRDQGSRADPATDADTVARDELISRKSDKGSDRDRPKVRNWTRIQETINGGVTGQHAGQGDHHHYKEAGEILGPTVTICVAGVGRSRGEPKRDQKRDGGEGVGDVVQGVAKQRDRP
jgi:hypothetical protein